MPVRCARSSATVTSAAMRSAWSSGSGEREPNDLNSKHGQAQTHPDRRILLEPPSVPDADHAGTLSYGKLVWRSGAIAGVLRSIPDNGQAISQLPWDHEGQERSAKVLQIPPR